MSEFFDPDLMAVVNTTVEQSEQNMPKVQDFVHDLNPRYKERENYFVPLKDDPTPESIRNDLAKLQGYADRVVFILLKATELQRKVTSIWQYNFDASLLSSTKKSVGEREAEARTRVLDEHNSKEKVKEFVKTCKMVLNNLEKTFFSLSAQIKTIQTGSFLGEISGEQSLFDKKKPEKNLEKGELEWEDL